MLSSKQGPIIPKRIYKSKQAFSNYFKIEWIMSLLGIMISIGYQSEMGWEKYARKKEGILYYPASIFLSRHSIQESAISIYFITTRYRSTTVINFDDVQYSDMNMLWKNQYPTKNDMGKNADIFRWHFSATKKQRCNIDDDATVIAATAYACADTKHYKNPDDQAKPGIAHTVFASINKANRKSEEEPKQLPGLETSTLHNLNAEDSEELSMEKKVEHALYAKSALMMRMPDIRPMALTWFVTVLPTAPRTSRRFCVMLKKLPLQAPHAKLSNRIWRALRWRRDHRDPLAQES